MNKCVKRSSTINRRVKKSGTVNRFVKKSCECSIGHLKLVFFRLSITNLEKKKKNGSFKCTFLYTLPIKIHINS